MDQTIEGKLHEALSGEMVPKFLATVDEQGKPNVVLIATIEPDGPRRMVFADFLMNKTAKNLDGNPKVGVCVITEDLAWWSMTGDHLGWEDKGELVERFNSKDLFRYNAYTGIRRAGKIDLRAVVDSGAVGKLALLMDFNLTRMRKGSRARPDSPDKMPPPVADKFGRLMAVKILAYVGADGYPVCFPVQSAQPADNGTLVFGTLTLPEPVAKMPDRTACAVNVVTFEPVSYQVKGTFTGYAGSLLGKTGAIEIESVWSTSPPLMGERIDQDQKQA